MKKWVCFGLALMIVASIACGDEDKRPVDVFALLDGRWQGTFVGYDASGKEQYRIRVEQTYRTVSATKQAIFRAVRKLRVTLAKIPRTAP